jgi:MATE family multidrug resistance protein
LQVSLSYRFIMSLALPLCAALIIPQLNILINTAFLGQLGEAELGVNGIAGLFYLVLSMIGYGLASGQQVQMARRAGEGDNVGLLRIFRNGIFLAVGFTVVLMAAAWLGGPALFRSTLHSAAMAESSVDFLRLRMWGLPFLAFSQLGNAVCIATGRSRVIAWGTAAGTAVNIAGDYFLIFGHGPFPAMGLAGAAIASIAAEAVACIVLYTALFSRGLLQTGAMSKLVFDAKLARKTLVVAAPLIVQYVVSLGGWQAFFIFVEHLGARELAASQILRSVFGILGIGVWAFASTSNTMVSNLIGQGRSSDVPRLIARVCLVSLSFTVVISSLVLLNGEALLRFYRDDSALAAFALPSLRVVALAALMMSVSTVVFNGVVGTGNTAINLAMEVTAVAMYLVYCTIVIERMRAGLQWAWMSEFVYWTVLIVPSLLYLRSGRWKGKKV